MKHRYQKLCPKPAILHEPDTSNSLKQLSIVKMYGKTYNIIWLDFSANDNSDGALNKFDTDISVHCSGKNRWLAPVIFKSTCKINVAFFPFNNLTSK